MEIKEKFGIIVLLDALGIQNSSIEESKKFVGLLRGAQNTFEPYLNSYSSSKEHTNNHYKNVKPTTRTFGDTLLLAWELPEDKDLYDYINTVSASVGYIIKYGIESGVLFRGAMSIGKYLESDTTIIGPAITDAAAWHEQADWFGCIATPNCSMVINIECKENNYPNIIKYNVPLKSGKKIDLWCVSWPSHVFEDKKEIDKILWFYQNIPKFNIPIGTEQKYINAEDFCKNWIKVNDY